MDQALKFKYKNWRGEHHTYIIDPEPGSLVFKAPGSGVDETSWTISGRCLMRDGEQRADWPRRTFKLSGMRDIEQIEHMR
jgi:hypothetical protein